MSYSEFTSIEQLAPLGIDTIETVSELIEAEVERSLSNIMSG